MTSPNQLSFLPEDYLERKARRRANVVCAALFVVVVGAIGSAFTLSDARLREIEVRRDKVDAEYTQAAKRIKEVQSMKDKQQRMARQAELTDSLLERVPRSYLLAEITNAMPSGISLLDLALDSKAKAAPVVVKTQFEEKRAKAKAAKVAKGEAAAPPPPAPKQYDVFLRVTGIADNDVQVAQFISRLNGSDLLKDVNLVISDEFQKVRNSTGEKTGDKMRRFQIEMSLRPDAEVMSTTDKTRTAAVELSN
ncbi:MAG TPA: PilN domain-containing protein [Tepidisphaeraceae bacterium]|jgi:Tfp pilus assembly protein PilN|nr:PilN domain-containing protein [Tepidisphaeraceae bacterium]